MADFKETNWRALLSTIPAMFALTFFGILHVPINVPALGVSTGADHLDVDRELIAHGISNALSGFCGSIQVTTWWTAKHAFADVDVLELSGLYKQCTIHSKWGQ